MLLLQPGVFIVALPIIEISRIKYIYVQSLVPAFFSAFDRMGLNRRMYFTLIYFMDTDM